MQELVNVDGTDALPAIWAQREDVIACLSTIRKGDVADENALEATLLASPPVEPQLIASNRKLEALGHLAQGLVSRRWQN
jgi:hypothetical protein